jgi:hypothetical protein
MARQVDILAKQMEKLQDQLKEQMHKFEKGSPELLTEDVRVEPSEKLHGKPELSNGLTASPEASIDGNMSCDDCQSSMRSEEFRLKRASGGSESSWSFNTYFGN